MLGGNTKKRLARKTEKGGKEGGQKEDSGIREEVEEGTGGGRGVDWLSFTRRVPGRRPRLGESLRI